MNPIDNLARFQENRQQHVPLPWKERTPLPRLLPEVPVLTSQDAQKILPEPLFSWAVDVSERLQVPLESVAVTGLSALGAMLGRKLGIHPKQHDDWMVLAVLWSAIVGRPGEKKSAIISEALKPIEILESEARTDFEGKQSAYRAELAVLKAKMDAVKDQLKAAAKADDIDELAKAQAALLRLEIESDNQKEYPKRFKTNDATVEKLGELLNENPNGLLIVRDELFGWLRGFDRTGHEQDRAFFLEAWNGQGRFTVDRVGRGTTVIEALCLTVVGGIQPGRLETLVRDATHGGAGDDGLLQRFQLMVYPERQRSVKLVDRKPCQDARSKLADLFRRIASLNPVAPGSVPGVHFASDAQAVYDLWAKHLESRLCAEDSLHPAFEAHLAKYRSLMPALALLFHVVEHDLNASGLAVSENSTRRAAAWCDLLEAHAAKVFSIAQNGENHGAHALVEKIKRGKVRDGDRLRDIYRHHWSLLSSLAEVESALSVLQECHWAHVEQQPTQGAPADVIRIHPDLLKEVKL